MKNKNPFRYLLFIAGVIFLGCSKPYQDALPTVQFVSAVPYGMADSVLITGNVTSAGASSVEYTGFCFSNKPSFDLLSRQVLLNGVMGQFSAIVQAGNDSTFYFKCFAANQFGYSTSNIFTYTVPSVKPDSAPCTINPNTVIFNGSPYSPFDILSGGNATYGSFYVEADFNGSYALDVYFNTVPTNGQYNVLNTQDFTNSTSKYAATIVLNNAYSFNEGGYVYISQNKNGSTTLSFCSLTVVVSSQNYTASSKVTF